MAAKLKVVFFDAAGTLIRVRGTVGEHYIQQARRYGYRGEAGVSEINRAFGTVFRQKQPLLVSASSVEELRDLEREWWRDVVGETFRLFGSFDRFDDFFRSVYDWFGTAEPWLLEPGSKDILERLRSQGFRLGIISNFDSRLTDVLSALEVDRHFDEIVISSVVGAAKPDPVIFRTALQRMQTEPRHSLHLGDDLCDDVEGATNAGLQAVLYDPLGQHPGYLGARIGSFDELFRFLL